MVNISSINILEGSTYQDTTQHMQSAWKDWKTHQADIQEHVNTRVTQLGHRAGKSKAFTAGTRWAVQVSAKESTSEVEWKLPCRCQNHFAPQNKILVQFGEL